MSIGYVGGSHKGDLVTARGIGTQLRQLELHRHLASPE